MKHPINGRTLRRMSAVAVLALAGVLLAAQPAAAQYVITPDRSIVNVGPARPFPVNVTMFANPVVVGGNRYVRVGGPFGGVIANPAGGYPGTGFLQPFTANDRARGANFYGSPNYDPRPVVTGPFRVWW
jgi:hypothetical protein